MLLKRIEMQGFKSFADKTTLDFVDGTTAIVGPNGSGKSNISDAVRWVIGETSAKSLRGASMHDVIFAGTATRRPLNFAEVSLVLDNTSHIFPLDYEEIVVTRRLFRSGESVYQINRVNCLLKNVHELFMDTGLGRDGYSIVGQGNVSRILSTKAEDRRSLFEEAAGIAKYKYRKDDACKKLARAEENLVRVTDIIGELEGQINPLKNQSEKARKYMDLYGEYKALDINMSLIAVDKNASESMENDRLYSSVSEELEELRVRESETELKINALYDENRRLDEKQSEKNALLVENEAKILKNENDIKLAENNINNSSLVIRRIDAEIEGIKSKNAERAAQIEELTKSAAQSRENAGEILRDFDRLKEESAEIDAEQERLRSEIEEKRGFAVSRQNDTASLREKISGIENLRASLIERREILRTEIKSYKEGISNTKSEISENERQAEQKREKHKKLSAAAEELRKRADGISAAADGISREINDLKIKYNSKLSQKRILEDMESSYEGYARSVKLVLKSDELKGLSIYGTLSGLINVNKKYVTAIETALGNALQNIVVESEDNAREAIEFLRRVNGGRATFLPITSVKSRPFEYEDALKGCAGFIGIASGLADCGRRYKEIVSNLLGRTVVADTLENAISISRKFGYKFRVVTLDGDIANAGGSISGGSVNKRSGFLSRSAQIKTLAAEISELSLKLKDGGERLKKRESELESVNNRLSSYIPLVREYEDELLRLENTISHLNATLENADGGAREEELEQLEEQLKASSDEIAELLSSVRAAQRESEAGQLRVEELEREYEERLRVKDEKAQSIMDETLRLANIENEVKTSEASIEELKSEIDAAADEIAEKNSEKERIHRENDALYAEIREKTELFADLKDASERLRGEIAEADAKKTEITEALQRIQSSNKDLTDTLLRLRGEMSRLEAKKERLESQKDSVLNRLWDEYELTYSEAHAMRTEVGNEKEASKRLNALRAEIKSLGSVNIDAIEEYKTVKERYEFLSAQKSDLEKSRDDLNKIIRSMEELMRENFSAQFGEINRSFGEVFSEMFGGGKGELSLSEPEDILGSGIEINVQLPGKSLQNINLYSGGERSFIAIALLFAILRVRPTPFCILDEIDAALDDVNVSRFATYLKNYADNTQFIIITHRRGSMEAANILYGVTMQEKGVSKLLSLMIDDVDEAVK